MSSDQLSTTPSAESNGDASLAENFGLGFKRALPIMLGYAPVAFAYGVLAVQNNIPPAIAIALSFFMLAGAGQFVTVSLWAAGADIVSAAIANLVMSLRYSLMAVAMVPYLEKLKGFLRLCFGWQITDELFAVHITAFCRGWKAQKSALFSATCLAHLAWVGGTVAGVWCGALVTDVKPLALDFALTGMIIALLIPQCTDNCHILCAILAAFFSVALRYAGAEHWNIVIATVVSATFCCWLQQRNKKKYQETPDQADAGNTEEKN